MPRQSMFCAIRHFRRHYAIHCRHAFFRFSLLSPLLAAGACYAAMFRCRFRATCLIRYDAADAEAPIFMILLR